MAREVRQLLQEGARRLPADSHLQARREAEWLLSRLVGLRPLELYLAEPPLPQPLVERFLAQIEARACGVPLQYVLGEAEFCGLSFLVRPGVFIPRPETEVVTQAAVEAIRALAQRCRRPLRLLDLGCGSGCIAVTLARAVPACVVVGIEVSWQALAIAKENVQRHGLTERVPLIQARWASGVRGRFDGIVSNPPYVPSTVVDRLPLEVRQEPRVSLDGGGDGTRELLSVLHAAAALLQQSGVLVLECGEEQVARLIDEAQRSIWVASVRGLEDLAGRPRGVLIEKAFR